MAEFYAGLATISHRGPDDKGSWEDASARVRLGHVRLAIQDLSPMGHQPMVSLDGRVVIAFNGEIFNFVALRQQLLQEGYEFRGHSDTEVLLNLYLSRGEGMLPILNGMFAFVIWDAARNAAFVARDEFGVKPLYYSQTNRGVVFSSEIKSLLCFDDVKRDIDPFALRNHLRYLWSPSPNTLLQGVAKLPPGSAMWVEGAEIIRQWRWSKPAAMQHPVWIDERVAISKVRDTVRTAVHRQMVSDVPVGAFLSGGLDSSSVVAFAREAIPKSRLQCFTIAVDAYDGQKEGMVDDLPYAQSVAKHLDVDLHVVRAGPEMADELERVIWHLDEPQADPAPINVLLIARLARRHGIKVLLSGSGGDDIFTGYRRHQALVNERLWSWMPRWVRSRVANLSQRMPADMVLTRRLSKALRYAGLEGDARIASYFRWLDDVRIDGLLSQELRAVSQRADPLVNSLRELPATVLPLNRMLHLECQHFLADHNLNYTDKMSMAVGVEVRVPLLDPDVVRLAFSLPLRLKQRGSKGKWILSEAMRGILPDHVLNRPKTGFGAPLRAWIHGPLKALVYDTLSDAAVRRRGLFDACGVRSLISQDAEGRVDGAYTIFSLLCIELWCRRFVDSGGRYDSKVAA